MVWQKGFEVPKKEDRIVEGDDFEERVKQAREIQKRRGLSKSAELAEILDKEGRL